MSFLAQRPSSDSRDRDHVPPTMIKRTSHHLNPFPADIPLLLFVPPPSKSNPHGADASPNSSPRGKGGGGKGEKNTG